MGPEQVLYHSPIVWSYERGDTHEGREHASGANPIPVLDKRCLDNPKRQSQIRLGWIGYYVNATDASAV